MAKRGFKRTEGTETGRGRGRDEEAKQVRQDDMSIRSVEAYRAPEVLDGSISFRGQHACPPYRNSVTWLSSSGDRIDA